MGKGVSIELLHERFHRGAVLIESRDDLLGLRLKVGQIFSGQAGLPVKINRECATDDNERKQQGKNLAAQRGNLGGQIFRRGGSQIQVVHGV